MELEALGYAESVSYETVRRTLKNRLKPPLKRPWVIPPRKSAAKNSSTVPLGSSWTGMACQLLDEVRNSSPIALGRPKRLDLGYERKGIAYVHMAFEPLKG